MKAPDNDTEKTQARLEKPPAGTTTAKKGNGHDGHQPWNAAMSSLDQEVKDIQAYFDSARFQGITRLYSARQIAAQRGTIRNDYTVAREAAAAFFPYLRGLFAEGRAVTTFGPYTPGQAVAMKRAGIKGIYVGGWASSAKGSKDEDPGPDLASYPLSRVPDEAAVLVRALLTADKNQHYVRSRMTEEERASTPAVDFRPFLICDADTGHGGDPHVRNLVRRFVEVGVPGYHIEDQRPGTKKCGHQGGKVLVASDEQLKRLNAARFQLDVMGVPGIIVARTDAEAATLLDGRADERDQPYILGATNIALPPYKVVFLSLLKKFYDLGVEEFNAFHLYSLSEMEYEAGFAWLERTGAVEAMTHSVEEYKADANVLPDRLLDPIASRVVDAWQAEAGIKTYGEAVAEVMEFRMNEGETFDFTVDAWNDFAQTASYYEARIKARELGLHVIWDAAHSKTPEGFYQVRGGLRYAIAKSLAAAPFADILWMETKSADLTEAKEFAEAIHAVYPDKMLAYNLSPSFNWDSTGMSDAEMTQFPEELGKLGYVFNFITYGGHQIDGTAAEEFSENLQKEGMLALARLQRKLRLVESPYRTPQTLVGGPRLDGALTASSGHTATTKAMGKGSTQFQHLIQTEVPPSLLEGWIGQWSEFHGLPHYRVALRPHRAGSDLLECTLLDDADEKLANVVFASIKDRNDRAILSVRDQNTFDTALRRKRLMTLVHLFLIHRYKISSVHYVTPTDDNRHQTHHLKALGIFTSVAEEVGEIIVADVDAKRIGELLDPDGAELNKLIEKTAE